MVQPIEIVITGGLPDGSPFDHATAGGNTWRRSAEESEDEFVERVRDVLRPGMRVRFRAVPSRDGAKRRAHDLELTGRGA